MTPEPPMDVWVYCTERRLVRAASAASPDALIVSASSDAVIARNGVVVRLNSTPRYILLALAAARGGILTADELHDLIFRERRDGGPMSLQAYVAAARTAAAALGLLLENHHTRGFSLRRVVRPPVAAVVNSPAPGGPSTERAA